MYEVLTLSNNASLSKREALRGHLSALHFSIGQNWVSFPRVCDSLGNSGGFKTLMQLTPERTASGGNSTGPESLRNSLCVGHSQGSPSVLCYFAKATRVQLYRLSRMILIFLENKTCVCSLPILLVLGHTGWGHTCCPPLSKAEQLWGLESVPFFVLFFPLLVAFQLTPKQKPISTGGGEGR